ncbi:hypothetical protein J4Q44_G00089710 [Coregonus suidteri]|uniref:Uncharacterized protein n=1 Tax=Coregonus suidteri TaxID=861788 RepID=A0AAN8QYJ2_9TELE
MVELKRRNAELEQQILTIKLSLEFVLCGEKLGTGHSIPLPVCVVGAIQAIQEM